MLNTSVLWSTLHLSCFSYLIIFLHFLSLLEGNSFLPWMQYTDVCSKYSILFPNEKASSINTFTALSSDRLKEELANQSSTLFRKTSFTSYWKFGLTSINVEGQGHYILKLTSHFGQLLNWDSCWAFWEHVRVSHLQKMLKTSSNLVLWGHSNWTKKFQKVKMSPNCTTFKKQFCFHNSWVHLGVGGAA